MLAPHAISIQTALRGPELSLSDIKKLGGRLGHLTPTHTRFTSEAHVSFVNGMRLTYAHPWSEATASFHEHLNLFPKSLWTAGTQLHVCCYWRYNHSLTSSKRHFRNIISICAKTATEKVKLPCARVQSLQFDVRAAKKSFQDILHKTSNWKSAAYASSSIEGLTRPMSVGKLGSRWRAELLQHCLKLAGMKKHTTLIPHELCSSTPNWRKVGPMDSGLVAAEVSRRTEEGHGEIVRTRRWQCRDRTCEATRVLFVLGQNAGSETAKSEGVIVKHQQWTLQSGGVMWLTLT